MQRSSESIAALAAALAKAQAELVNPEKLLVGTVRSEGRGEQSFRYASLSSGLDIVRKTLGAHEIATVQTTAIDQAAGTVNLTTVLAHASGQWIASDWPVCAISETATPRRMGAALTYARRYALFTLVGIAGEDDLDAPDLAAPTPKAAEPETKASSGNGSLNGGSPGPAKYHAPPIGGRNDKRALANATPLGLEASAALRDRLLGELETLGSGEEAALWAHRSLAEKSRLTPVDSGMVEERFKARLILIEPLPLDPVGGATEPDPAGASTLTDPPSPRSHETEPKKRRRAKIDKSVLALPEPRRVRDRDHVRYVAQQPCLICGRQPADAHHLRYAQGRALGRKVSDEFTVPLCRGHHRELHRHGDEAKWWRTAGLDPTVTARALWLESHASVSLSTSQANGDVVRAIS
jgi:hypothetical protein